jgi:hypothetical protein
MTKNTFLILIITVLTFSNAANAGKLYRWVDENGKVSFSDKVPPKASRLEREELNEKGRTIAIKDAAKTPEQLQQLKKLNALKKQQAELLQKQVAQDEALLKTFQSEADIDALANSKFDMVDSHISIASSQSETLKKQLITHQQSAAEFERSGKKVPAKIIDNIQSAQQQFDKNQREISSLKSQKSVIEEQLRNDRLRFNTLKKQAPPPKHLDDDTTPSLLIGEITCNADKCKNLWPVASEFLTQNNDTAIVFNSQNLVLSATPKLSTQKALTLAKIKDNDVSKVTLDIRCKNTKLGKETCKNEQNQALIDRFNQLGANDLTPNH